VVYLPLASNVAIDCSTSTLKASLFPSSPLSERRPALAMQKHLAATERFALDAFSSILIQDRGPGSLDPRFLDGQKWVVRRRSDFESVAKQIGKGAR
jgi:hypothetical protein